MQKMLRILAVVLFLIATFAVVSTPSSAAAVGEGSAPTPLCAPGDDSCRAMPN